MTRKKKSSTGKKSLENAAQKHAQKPHATKVKAKVTPQVAAEQAIKAEARKVRRKPQVSVAEALPKPQSKRHHHLTMAERLAIVAGGVFLVVGVVGLLQRPNADAPTADVKQQNIPMTMEDFKDDPAIQGAIQKQLGGSDVSAPTPQEQQTQSPQAAGGSLQTPGGNLQAQ